MNTAFLLMARYDAAPVIPLDLVCRDFFQHLSPVEFARKATNGDIALPVVRIDGSSKQSAKGIALQDLAQWIDDRTSAARKECQQLTGAKFG
jgi:hypothetical protein